MNIAGLRPTEDRSLGLDGVQGRINDIQRRMGVSSLLAPTGSATTGAPSNAPAAASSDFSLALQRAQTSSPGSDELAKLYGTGAQRNGVGPTDAVTTALLEALGVTPVYATKPAGLPNLGISDTMTAAGNGRLPDTMLVGIGEGAHRLTKPAADAFGRLSAAARRDGVTFGVTDSYRDHGAQVDVARRLGLYGQGGLAAVPGSSNHGWGLALDLELGDQAQGWMADNAWRYGYFNDVPGEPWHWTYRAS